MTGPDDPENPDDATVAIPLDPPATPPEVEAPSAPSAGDGAEPTSGVPPSAWPADDVTRVVARPSGDLASGTVLGNYRVGKLIARGGLGAIYEGVNVHNPDERVAIKTISPGPDMTEGMGKMLRDEANALMRVRHDAVVPYRTFGGIPDSNEFYLVLEFIDGDPLIDFYRRRRLTDRELFSLAKRLAAGLQASHEEGLVHRDISPDNVLLPNNQLDKAILIDFGIAKNGETDGLGETQFGGKLSYAAPEQFERGGRIGPWTDIYSLALLLIAAARGQSMPMGKSIEEAQAARRAVPAIKGVPPALVPLLQRMLEPNPSDRPQNMGEVLALLDQAERGPVSAPPATPTPAPTPASAPVRRPVVPAAPVRRTPRQPQRGGGSGIGRTLGLALAALIVGAAAVGGIMFFSGDEPAPPVVATPTEPDGPDGPLPQQPRSEQLAGIMANFRTALANAPCGAVRLSGADSGTSFAVDVSGVWSDQVAIRKLVDTAAAETGASVTMAGETFDASLCPALAALKPVVADLGARVMSRPKAGGRDDRASVVELTTDPALPAIALFEVDAAGRVSLLADLSTPDKRSALTLEGRLTERGGRYELALIPPAPDANVAPTLVIAAMSETPLTGPAAAPIAQPVEGWVAQLNALGIKPRFDVMPRDGVPAGSAPVGTQEPREQVFAKARQAVVSRFASLACSAVRVDAKDDGRAFSFKVGGIWGNYAGAQNAAAEAGAAANGSVTIEGRVIDNALCPMVDAVRGLGTELGPAVMGPPQAADTPDRASFVTLTAAEGVGALYVLEVGRDGLVKVLMDLGSAEARTAAVGQGLVEDLGDRRLRVKLTPLEGENVEATLLVALAAAQPLPGFATPGGLNLNAWLVQASRAAASSPYAIDVIDRPGIAEKTTTAPTNEVAALRERLQEAFRAIECSAIRLQYEENAGAAVFKVHGLWGMEARVKATAEKAASDNGVKVTLEGDRISRDLCRTVDALKPFFKDGEPPSILSPTPTGRPDRTVSVPLIGDATYPFFYFLVVDPEGQIESLIEVSNQGKVAAAIKRGLMEQSGSLRYRIFLPPFSDDADTRSSMLVALLSKERLPDPLFEFPGKIGFSRWKSGLDEFAKTVQLRIDMTEYVQVPPN